MAENFQQNGDCPIQFILIDYHEVDDLKVYFNEVADGRDLLVVVQFPHQSFAKLSAQLHVAFPFGSFY